MIISKSVHFSGCLTAGLALLAVGCGRSGGYTPEPVTPPEPVVRKVGEEEKLMPLIEGSRWTYELETVSFADDKELGNNTQTLVFEVKRSSDTSTGRRASLELLLDDNAIDRQQWLVTNQGIFQVSVGLDNSVFSPIQPVLRFPATEGSKFSWTGIGICPDGTVGKSTADSIVLPAQKADSQMGVFAAVPVESKIKFSSKVSGVATNTTWFRPNVGIVRLRQEVFIGNRRSVTTLRLKNYSLKQS